MVRGAVVVGPSILSVRNLIYTIDLAWGEPVGLRNDLFFMVFWVLYMCEIFWFQSLYQLRLMVSLSISPPLLHSSASGSKPCQRMCQQPCSKLSVCWRYLYFWKWLWLCSSERVWFTWTLPAHLTPEEKNQVGGTHVSFVYQSARPQIRLVLTWRNKFPFHSTT